MAVPLPFPSVGVVKCVGPMTSGVTCCVTIDPRWLNFTQFLNSMDKLPGIEEWRAGMDVHLDKDLRVPGSRTYGLDTCWFIPATANLSKMVPE